MCLYLKLQVTQQKRHNLDFYQSYNLAIYPFDQLLQALEVRSLDPLKRYRDFPEDERYRFRPDYVEKPGIVRTMVEAAEESSRRRLHEIQQPGETPFSDPP